LLAATKQRELFFLWVTPQSYFLKPAWQLNVAQFVGIKGLMSDSKKQKMYSFLFDQCQHEDNPQKTFSELSFSLFL
jgi:hypothetical protein